MGASSYVQMMIESLKMKEKILRQMIEMNKEQATLATAENFDEQAFHTNMEEKGALIDNLVKLDEGFQSVYNRMKDEMEQNKSAYAKEILIMKQLIQSVTELGVDVQAQEIRNKDLVQSRFHKMRWDLQNAKRSTKIANTYYKSQKKLDTEPQFLDWKQ